MFAQLWDRHIISDIHLTMAQGFSVQTCGRFYDVVGAVCGIIRSHPLQVLALIAMEPTMGPSVDGLNDKRPRCFARCRL